MTAPLNKNGSSGNGNAVPTLPASNLLPDTNGNGNGHAVPTPTASSPNADNGNAPGINALIAEAEALKEALRAVYGRSDRLLVALKRHRKQSKLVQTTLASLRQLQSIEQ